MLHQSSEILPPANVAKMYLQFEVVTIVSTFSTGFIVTLKPSNSLTAPFSLIYKKTVGTIGMSHSNLGYFCKYALFLGSSVLQLPWHARCKELAELYETWPRHFHLLFPSFVF